MALTFGSLFAGIGGFDLGFERAGMACKWQVEIDDYANRVLAKHWPNVPRFGDIQAFPPRPASPWLGANWREKFDVDVICGGFPCQDISYAGLGAGLDGERSGLFFEAIRVVRELRPRIVVLENVAALLTRGLDRVLGTLAEIGFDAEWDCIPAAAVGAPHIRDRVFVLAYSRHRGIDQRTWGPRGEQKPEASISNQFGGDGENRNVANVPDANSRRQQIGEKQHSQSLEDSADGDSCREHTGGPCYSVANATRELFNGSRGGPAETRRAEFAISGSVVANANEPRLQGRNSEELREREEKRVTWSRDSLQEFRDRAGGQQWFTEPDVGRVANGIPARVDRLRGLGNAVVPQVAEWIGRRIIEHCNSQESVWGG